MLEGGSIIECVRRSPFTSSVLRACIPLIISWKFLGEPPKIYQQSELREKKSWKKLGQKKVKRRRLRALDVWTEIETAGKSMRERIWAIHETSVSKNKKGNLLTTTSRKQSPPRTRPAIRKATRAQSSPITVSSSNKPEHSPPGTLNLGGLRIVAGCSE